MVEARLRTTFTAASLAAVLIVLVLSYFQLWWLSLVAGVVLSIALGIFLSRWLTRAAQDLAATVATRRPAAVSASAPRELSPLVAVLVDAQHDLIAAGQQLHYLAAHSRSFVVVCDAAGTITFAAGPLLDELGLYATSKAGTSIAPLCPPGESVDACLTRLSPDGDHFWQLMAGPRPIDIWAASVQRENSLRRGAFVFVGLDTSPTHTAQDTQQLLEQIRALSEQARSVAEAERKHIAGELHDLLGQELTAVRQFGALILSAATHAPGQPAMQTPIPDYAVAIDKIAMRLQGIVQSLLLRLWPESLDSLGLGAALKDLGLAFQQQHPDVKLSVRVPSERPALIGDQAIALYRVATEALTNIARHAGATDVLLSATCEDGEFAMVIADNGAGFDTTHPATGRHGLIGMRERICSLGGELEIDSSPNEGTTIIARVPLTATSTNPAGVS